MENIDEKISILTEIKELQGAIDRVEKGSDLSLICGDSSSFHVVKLSSVRRERMLDFLRDEVALLSEAFYKIVDKDKQN